MNPLILQVHTEMVLGPTEGNVTHRDVDCKDRPQHNRVPRQPYPVLLKDPDEPNECTDHPENRPSHCHYKKREG